MGLVGCLWQQEQHAEEAVEIAEKKRAKGTGRMILPEELRREVIVIEPDEDTINFLPSVSSASDTEGEEILVTND